MGIQRIGGLYFLYLPDESLKYQFEAISELDNEGKRIIREVFREAGYKVPGKTLVTNHQYDVHQERIKQAQCIIILNGTR